MNAANPSNPGDLRVSLTQQNLIWEDSIANRAAFDKVLAPLAGATDLVLLPEMFTTGFSMHAKTLAEAAGTVTPAWMLDHANRLDAAVAGSVMVRDGDRFFNRFYWAEPGGRLLHYDKRHLFTLAGEHEVFSAGRDPLTVAWRGWRVRAAICYDLRFPVWLRNDAEDSPGRYDLLAITANWPERRSYPWKQLLRARAIENMACVAAVNCVGEDGNGIRYSGDSALIDSLGETLCEISGEARVATRVLSGKDLGEARARFAFLNDADRFEIKSGPAT